MYRPRIHRLRFTMLTLLTLTACHHDPDPPIATPSHDDAQQTPQTSATPPPTATMPPPVTTAPSPPPLPEGTSATYQCVDGNQVTVTYTYVTAHLRWPDGRQVKLSRAASPSGDGGDVYTGGKASLRHAGGTIQFNDGAAATTCSESAATA